MFSSLDSQLSVRRHVPYVAGFLLHILPVLILLLLPRGGHHRPHLVRASAGAHASTPLYFAPQPPPPEESKAPVLASAHPAPKPEAVKPSAEPDSATPANDSTDDRDQEGDDELATSWVIDDEPDEQMMGDHVITSSRPVFTPEPSIMHHGYPQEVRGKDVVVIVMVSPEGHIVMATVMQGVGKEIEDQIAETLRRWVFVPAKIQGRPWPSRRQLTFHFPD